MSTLQVPIQISVPGQLSPDVNVWHCRGGVGSSDVEALRDFLSNLEDFYSAVAGLYPSDVVLSTPDAATTVEETPTYVTVDDGMAWQIPGTGGSNKAPKVLQIVVSWTTNVASRSGRGRTFLGPLSRDFVDTDGTPTPGAMSGARGAAAALVAHNSVDLAASNLVIYSKKDGVARDVQRSRVKDAFGVLRSRRE